MSRLNDFLTEAGIFYVATNDGAQPKLRPFGAHVEVDGVVHFAVGDFKAVYKQMLANPLTEIVACKPDGVWLRYTGKIVFDTDKKSSAFTVCESNDSFKIFFGVGGAFAFVLYLI